MFGDPVEILQSENFEIIGIEKTEDSEEVFAIRKHSIDPTSLETNGMKIFHF